MTQRRNRAFYKRDGKPWTQKEYRKIIKFCEGPDAEFEPIDEELAEKYIFDNGTDDPQGFMHPWLQQEKDPNFKNCIIFEYNNYFVDEQEVEEVYTVPQVQFSFFKDKS